MSFCDRVSEDFSATALESGFVDCVSENTLEYVIDLIRERVSEPPHIRELASRAGLSERQFRRRFSARTGMNYIEFLQEQRIALCCNLLVSTNEKVTLIARKAGYQDIKFFNRLFKKKTGMTPKQFRSAGK
ncbi:helix-turn-helix domain-containing protein [Paenibacillus alkalitolerans]|uniref:helix-turn-helix domain-containing protein n=1 Tax=Paenibacillus alkalitolerans TaxID=2799335 RepID=UPI0018F3F7E5|nr:AraC family transcriptional regulator [Paenibacillus alkalitolerans]